MWLPAHMCTLTAQLWASLLWNLGSKELRLRKMLTFTAVINSCIENDTAPGSSMRWNWLVVPVQAVVENGCVVWKMPIIHDCPRAKNKFPNMQRVRHRRARKWAAIAGKWPQCGMWRRPLSQAEELHLSAHSASLLPCPRLSAILDGRSGLTS